MEPCEICGHQPCLCAVIGYNDEGDEIDDDDDDDEEHDDFDFDPDDPSQGR